MAEPPLRARDPYTPLKSEVPDYSFGYVANWAGGGEQAIAGITASCQNIQKAAVNILGHFEVGDQEVAA